MPWIYHISNQAGSMTRSEMENNALLIYQQLAGYGWTINAVSGVLGNFEYESYLNPAQWQIGHSIDGNTGGVGLGQWTPPSHWIEYANLKGYNKYDGARQVDYLHNNNIYYSGQYWGSQWNSRPSPGWSWDYYKSSTDTPEACADAFFRQWEQADDETSPTRQKAAREWYEWLGGKPPIPVPTSRKMPLWMYLRRF